MCESLQGLEGLFFCRSIEVLLKLPDLASTAPSPEAPSSLLLLHSSVKHGCWYLGNVNATLHWYQPPLKCTKRRSCLRVFLEKQTFFCFVFAKKKKKNAMQVCCITWQPSIACLCVLSMFENKQKVKWVQPAHSWSRYTRPQGRSWQNTPYRRDRGSKKGENLCFSAWKIQTKQAHYLSDCFFFFLLFFFLNRTRPQISAW